MTMHTQIEQIVQADHAARVQVAEARTEAARIRAEAQQQADAIATSQKAHLTKAVADESRSIHDEAQSKAYQVKIETDAYLKRLRHRKEALLSELVARLVQKVTCR